jgi:hypothetical protein
LFMLNTVEAWPHLCAQYAPFIEEGVNSCQYAQLVTIFKDSFTNDVICTYLREYCSILQTFNLAVQSLCNPSLSCLG